MFEPTDSRAVRVLIPAVVFLVLGNLQLSAENYTKCQGRAESRTAYGCEAGGHVTIFRHLHSWQNKHQQELTKTNVKRIQEVFWMCLVQKHVGCFGTMEVTAAEFGSHLSSLEGGAKPEDWSPSRERPLGLLNPPCTEAKVTQLIWCVLYLFQDLI